jgi:hypothetical protein
MRSAPTWTALARRRTPHDLADVAFIRGANVGRARWHLSRAAIVRMDLAASARGFLSSSRRRTQAHQSDTDESEALR